MKQKITGKMIMVNEGGNPKKAYETTEVSFNGEVLSPLEFQTVPHYSDSFNWGYGGSGPAFFAYVLLLIHTGDPEVAHKNYQAFKWQHIATQAFGKAFDLDLDIDQWLQEKSDYEATRYSNIRSNGGD